jgi:hypothetical protein
MTAKPVKLTPAQYRFLIEVNASKSNGVYAYDGYLPAKKLASLGMIEDSECPNRYTMTETGVEWVENAP